MSIQLVYNPGVAFSPGSTLPLLDGSALTGKTIATLGGYLIARQRLSAASSAGGALLLGGVVGNLIDRLDGRGVVNSLHTGRFATCNLASAFVTAGVATLVLGMLIGQRNQTRTLPEGAGESPPSQR